MPPSSTTATTKETSMIQEEFHVPDIPLKELREVIPAHCFQRSAVKSFFYLVRDIFIIGTIYALTTTYAETLISSMGFQSSAAAAAMIIAIWSLYGFCVGLFATGLWVVAHECGHDAFSVYTWVNNSVGWILHSALGVPYYSWRITHRNHHRFTAHAEKDEVFVPLTRSDCGLKEFDSGKEDFWGAMVTEEVKKEMWDALGDSPVGAMITCAGYLLAGWPSYLLFNASGQKRPWTSNHLNPKAEMYSSSQFWQIIISDIGVFIWLGAIFAAIYHFGFQTVFRVYLVPYLWVNHWVVAISFLQHTDTCLPRYRDSQFTFVRGALTTLDRNMMGDLGPLMEWIGAYATHGVSETHLLHHVCSRIPHYHAWKASQALKRKLAEYGYTRTEGGAVGWAELYRVYKECKFIEDHGDVVFYKNSYGLAKMRPILSTEGKYQDHEQKSL